VADEHDVSDLVSSGCAQVHLLLDNVSLGTRILAIAPRWLAVASLATAYSFIPFRPHC
jgi:hypothetical protein